MEAYIKAISYYLPERVITNEEMMKDFPEWSVDKVANKVGVVQRHIADDNELSSDLAIKAANKLFKDYSIAPKSIDFVLFCSQSPDYLIPTTACIIQEKLNLSKSAGALDFNLGCSGFIYGLSLAKGLIVAGICKNVLLLTAETYSKYIHPKDKGNRTIFGDGAAATLVSNGGDFKIMNFCLGTDGKGAGNLMLKTGGIRYRSPSDDLKFSESGNPISSDYLFMNGPEIFNFTLENVPILIYETLKKNFIDFDNVGLFLFHQANKYLLEFLRKKIKIPQDKFYNDITNTGNTVSSTIPIAFTDAILQNRVVKGSNILMAGFGVGYSWGGCMVHFV